MASGFHVSIVTEDGGFAARIESALSGEILSFRVVAEDDIERETPGAQSIVFLDTRGLAGEVTGLITRLARVGGETSVIVVAEGESAESVLESMRAGATDFLSFPIDPDEVLNAVRRIAERENEDGARGRILAVFSLKGGQGVTSLATNLADHIHLLTGQTCLLADLNLYMGHACVCLNLECAYTPFDLVSDLNRADDNLLFSSLVQSERGFHVLGISDRIADASEITSGEVGAMLDLLRRHVRYTVLDLPHDLSDRVLAGLDAADRILLVVQQDVPSLKSAQLALRVFSDLDYDGSRIAIVVNRHGERNEIGLQDIENALKRPVTATIRNDYPAIAASFNRGQTVDAAGRDSRVNLDFAKLAGWVTGMPPRVRKRWWQGLPSFRSWRSRA